MPKMTQASGIRIYKLAKSQCVLRGIVIEGREVKIWGCIASPIDPECHLLEHTFPFSGTRTNYFPDKLTLTTIPTQDSESVVAESIITNLDLYIDGWEVPLWEKKPPVIIVHEKDLISPILPGAMTMWPYYLTTRTRLIDKLDAIREKHGTNNDEYRRCLYCLNRWHGFTEKIEGDLTFSIRSLLDLSYYRTGKTSAD
jgi:hypothetical protein